MKDSSKTKDQLIEELGELRRKLSVLDNLDSEHRQAEETLRESEERHRVLFESSRDAIMILAPPSWNFTSGNPTTIRMFGVRDEHDFCSLPPWKYSPEFQPDGRPSVDKAKEMIQTAMRDGSHFFEWRHRRTDGEQFPATVLLSRIEISGQALLQATVRDITERKQMEDELKKLVITDKLTKAYNRVKFEEIIAIEMERVTRYDHPLSLLIIDIDGFKNVNDTCGHLAGDYVLKAVADILQSHMRKINHLIRWGGDEFVIMPVETGLDGARIFSERLRQAIESFDFGKAGNITISIGIALFKKDDTEDTFLKRADDALYKAKTSGGNRVEAGV